jgi:pimeloyl-ACP methyl ester carboxylesterase
VKSSILILLVVAIVVIVAAVLGYHSYQRDLDAARARVASGSKLVNTPCGPIEYAVAGNGPPALMIHGAGGGFDQALDFGGPLIEHGFTVIAPSRFGYLRTPLPQDASPMSQADSHACLLDALGIRNAVVLGGSAGAPSAIQLCLRHPERCSALVLVVPITYSERSPQDAPNAPSALTRFMISATLQSDFAFWVISHVARDTTIKSVLATPPEDVRQASEVEKHRVDQVLRNIEPIKLRAKGLMNDGAIAGSIKRYELEKIKQPTLVLSVENDLFGTFKGARYTAEHIRGAQFVGYHTGGHLWVGHQEGIWAAITQFLASAAAAKPQESS